MTYDLFISYSRKDNEQGRITELKEKIEADYLEFAKEELKCFFDRHDIQVIEDWRHKILEGLKESTLFLLVLSPNYLISPHCEWEIVEYLKYEHSRAVQGQGVAPIYFVEIPGLGTPDFEQKAAEWVKRIRRRNDCDLRPWHKEGIKALERQDVLKRLKELEEGIQTRLSRLRRIASAPGNLPAPNPQWVGRSEEMRGLHESVGLGKLGVLTALHGMGGLGKTAMAVQYAYAYADFYPGGRWLLGCAKSSDLPSIIRKLDIDLNITFSEEEKRDDVRAAKRVLHELESRSRRGAEARAGEKNPPAPCALLILDNVDSPALLQTPQMDLINGKPWLHVLATTRLGVESFGYGEDSQTSSFLAVDKLPTDDALSLIESYQPHKQFANETERTAAREIVKILDGFTLAVEVVAVYLGENKNQITCAAYLQRLQNEGIIGGLDSTGKETHVGIKYDKKLISITLSPTLDSLSPQETAVLSYAALLPLDSIPLPWLRALVTKEYPELGQDAPAGHQDPWLLVANHLLDLRILQIMGFDTDGRTPRLVRIHRLVQELMKKRNLEKMEKLEPLLLDYLKARSDFLWEGWVDHQNRWEIEPLTFAAWYWMEQGSIYGAYLAGRTAGQPLRELGNLKKAKVLLQKAITIQEKVYKPDHPALATSYSDLALVESDLKNLEEAKRLLQKAIVIDENIYKSDRPEPELAKKYSNLALVEQDLGNLEEAKRLLEKAIVIQEKAYKPDHPILATSYSNLALVEKDLKNLEESKRLLQKAIAIWELAFKSNHPLLATGYSNLALVESDLKNLEESKRLLQKAIVIDENIYDQNNSKLATLYANLAWVEGRLGSIKNEKHLLLKSITMEERTDTPDYASLTTRYSYLGTVEYNLGNLEEAKQLLQKAIAVDEKYHVTDNPTLATKYLLLALVERDFGNLEKSASLMRRNLEILIQVNINTKQTQTSLRDNTLVYANILKEMGHPIKEILIQINDFVRPFGFEFDGTSIRRLS